MRGAGALAAGENPQQPRGLAAGLRVVLAVGYVDDPTALADRNAGERGGVLGVKLALGQSRRDDRGRQQRGQGQPMENLPHCPTQVPSSSTPVDATKRRSYHQQGDPARKGSAGALIE